MVTENIFLKNVTHVDELPDVYGSIHDGGDDDLKGIMYSISMILFINSILCFTYNRHNTTTYVILNKYDIVSF